MAPLAVGVSRSRRARGSRSVPRREAGAGRARGGPLGGSHGDRARPAGPGAPPPLGARRCRPRGAMSRGRCPHLLWDVRKRTLGLEEPGLLRRHYLGKHGRCGARGADGPRLSLAPHQAGRGPGAPSRRRRCSRSAALSRSSEVSRAPCGAATPPPNPLPAPRAFRGAPGHPGSVPQLPGGYSASAGWPGPVGTPRCLGARLRSPAALASQKELLHAEIQPGSWAAAQNSSGVGVPCPAPGRVRIYRR